MQVPEEIDLKLLSIFTDNLPHSYFEVVYLGTIYLNVKQSYTEKLLHRAVVDNTWITRVAGNPSLKESKLKLTEKGDQYYRSMMIRRGGEYRYYKYFNRQQETSGFSEMGLDKFAPLPSNLQRIDPDEPK